VILNDKKIKLKIKTARSSIYSYTNIGSVFTSHPACRFVIRYYISYNLLPSPCTCELVGSANGVRRPVQKISNSVNRKFGLIVTPVVDLCFVNDKACARRAARRVFRCTSFRICHYC